MIAFPETWLSGYPVWPDYAREAVLWAYAPAEALYRLLVEKRPDIFHLEVNDQPQENASLSSESRQG